MTNLASVQHPAPAFTATAVINGQFQDISLSDLRGKWVVLAFIPMAWTFVCPTEVLAFSDAVDQFRSRGVDVLFASTDSKYTLLQWSLTSRREGGVGNLNIPLLSDKNMQISRDYGVLIEKEGIALRGLFIIDPQGIMRQITINDLPVGRSVDEVLRLVEAFQFTDEHGEVCPANWRAGEPTIVADPVQSKAYFQNLKESNA